jgi:pantetheine-phosphate adenylyltransferase
MRVCFSGTFNVLHKGHKRLIDTAFQTAGDHGTVFIGVTRGELLHKKERIIPFDDRVHTLQDYLTVKGYAPRAVITGIHDEYGPAAYGDYDAIIVSPETRKNAEDINKKRAHNGKKPLKIVSVPFVLAEDDLPISSTRIMRDEIDENGQIVT